MGKKSLCVCRAVSWHSAQQRAWDPVALWVAFLRAQKLHQPVDKGSGRVKVRQFTKANANMPGLVMAPPGNDVERIPLKMSLLLLICGDSSTFSMSVGGEKNELLLGGRNKNSRSPFPPEHPFALK